MGFPHVSARVILDNLPSVHPEPMQEEAARKAITEAAEEQLPALPKLIEAQYDSLVRMAERLFAGESPSHSVSPSSLVHEAYVRLLDQPKVTSRGSVFFRACFAQECRRVLVDRARRRSALSRGGHTRRETLADQAELGFDIDVDVLDLHEALDKLAEVDALMARIVELRFFGDLTIAECATTLDKSKRTIDSKWAFARAWLQRELGT